MDTTQRVFKAARHLRSAYRWTDQDGQLNTRLIDHQRVELKLALERWDRERVGSTAANAVKESITSPSPISAAKTSRLSGLTPGGSCRGPVVRLPRRTAATARCSCGTPLADLIGEN